MTKLSETLELTQKPGYGVQLRFSKVMRVTKTGKLSLSDWYTCREDFYKTWKGRSMICFGTTHPRRFLNFIRIAEKRIEKLGVEKVPATKVGRTNVKGISWIDVSDWWLAEPMRMSFFTEFIRAGTYFDRPLKDNEKPATGCNNGHPDKVDFYTALWMRPMFKTTQAAVLRFLDGYTHYTGKAGLQWYTAMYHNGYQQGPRPVVGPALQKLLVMPKANPLPHSGVDQAT